jgi:DNA-binding CsgD family transcriptional regulator/PAS domain-containing protein
VIEPMSWDEQRLLQCVAEGALESPPWQSLVREMRQAFAASFVVLLFQRPKSIDADFIEIHDFESRPFDLPEQYRLHFGSTPPPVPYFAMQPGKAYRMRDLVDDLQNSLFFNKFLKPAALDEILLSYVEEPGGFRCWTSIVRREDMGLFSAEDIARFEWLMGHMRSALMVYAALKKVELDRDIYASALRNLHMGYLLLDRRGRVIELDEEAERLLADNPDLFLSGGQLKVKMQSKNEELQRIIAEGLGTFEEFSRGLSIPGPRTLGVLIKSAPESPLLASHVAPHLVVYINEPNAPAAAPKARIAELFELSPTEAALAVELVRGRTLAEAAEAINITEQTARSYSKRIFSKTGTRRQADLVRLILTSVALVA